MGDNYVDFVSIETTTINDFYECTIRKCLEFPKIDSVQVDSVSCSKILPIHALQENNGEPRLQSPAWEYHNCPKKPPTQLLVF